MCKETPKTKSAFVKWAYIKASNCSTVPKSVLFEERIPENILELQCATEVAEATFIRRVSAVSNAIQTIDNEANHLIIYCLNCIRHGRNATYEPGLEIILDNGSFRYWITYRIRIYSRKYIPAALLLGAQ